MIVETTSKEYEQNKRLNLSALLRPALSPLPLFVLQPVLNKIVMRIAQDRPELFNRIGTHKDKYFLIDPVNLPFVMVLLAHPDKPSLKAYRRRKAPNTSAKISGTFLTLLDMVDGRLDGDALFFTRKLRVEGDTEAVVCLRNALDDLEGSIAEDTANFFGLAGRTGLEILRKVRDHDHEQY